MRQAGIHLAAQCGSERAFFRCTDLLIAVFVSNGTTGALLHAEMERPSQSCTVAEIQDGDTLTAQCDRGGRALRVRISSIDAPELAQRHGREAREALASLTAGGAVMVRVVDTDKYGRTVAAIQLPDGRDVARENAYASAILASDSCLPYPAGISRAKPLAS